MFNNLFFYGNDGLKANSPYTRSGGGGGSGNIGLNAVGGTGRKCFLQGISDFNIKSNTYSSGIPVSSLYWGGGGRFKSYYLNNL